MKSLKKLGLSLGFLFLFFASSSAQKIDPKQEAIFVYNIVRYIEWPGGDGHDDFIIGVLGKGDIVKEIQSAVSQKMVGTRKIIVKKFFDSGSVQHCHVLFITKSHSCCLKIARKKLKDMTALIVTENKDMVPNGADINFITRVNKIMFEMNEKSMKSHNLKINSELRKFAVIVNN